jgi:hypothetical protein
MLHQLRVLSLQMALQAPQAGRIAESHTRLRLEQVL